MKLSVTVDSKGIEATVRNTVRELPKEIRDALLKTAIAGTQIIQDRTEIGKGYLGPFTPYSLAYARFRKNKGRQASFVDLSFTGRMLAGMTQTVGGNSAYIQFNTAENSKKAYFTNAKRPWFGFNDPELTKLSKYFEAEIR